MVLWWGIVVTISVLGMRVFYLTVVKGDFYSQAAVGNSIKEIPIKAPRGRIFDRFGTQLTHNIPTLEVVISPRTLPEDRDTARNVILRSAALLQVDPTEALSVWEKEALPGISAIPLKENITQEESLLLLGKENELPGIVVEKASKRFYVDSAIFAHVIGYEGKIRKDEFLTKDDYLFTDRIGKDGIEKTYEQYLRGNHGARYAVVDSFGTVISDVGKKDAKQGKDIFLNIDAGLQKKIFDSLSNVLERAHTRTAAAIVLDPRDGSVRALVSLPSFDNNIFAEKTSEEDYQRLISDDANPLFDRAISGEYAPGSTIKPFVAVAALREGIITPEYQIESRGAITVGSSTFHDWRVNGFADVRRAIAVSSDVYFYTVGGGYGNIAGLGMDRMKRYESLFGFGDLTGIDLPGEKAGFIPDEKWKEEVIGERWYIGNSYHAAIGQGFVSVTPLQLVAAVSAIANGGTLWQPHIVSDVTNGDQTILRNEPHVLREGFIAKDILQIVKEGMRQTVTDGTATSLQSITVPVAGKTGTAQFGSEGRTHSWFVSFAPYENPEIAMVVLVEGQTDEISSSTVPVTKEVYEWYFNRE